MSVSVLCADTVEKKKNWFQALELEYEVNAGVNIGGASPIPPAGRDQAYRFI